MTEEATRKIETGPVEELVESRAPDSDWPIDRFQYVNTVIDGRYLVGDRLGEGGMSVVFKATHVAMKAVRAIKIMHTRLLSDEQSVRRFIQEAQAASNLHHPNVITIYDTGITERSEPYIVMDCLSGPSLSELLKRELVLERERAIDIFIQICNGLAAAHEVGIVHRDLKPSNVMIERSPDGDDRVVILDFGIAKVLTQDEARQMELTQTGEIFGSPLYMSPEQCTGSRVDSRSDIYSLGCLMYESLTGKPPLAGATIYDTIRRQVSELPDRFAAVRPELAGVDRLESIVFRCLAKEPSERFQSMLELRSSLNAVRRCSRVTIKDAVGTLKDLLYLEFSRFIKKKSSLSSLTQVIAVLSVGAFVAFSLWLAAPLPPVQLAPLYSLWDLELDPEVASIKITPTEAEKVREAYQYVRIADEMRFVKEYKVRKRFEFADLCYGKGAFEYAKQMYLRLHDDGIDNPENGLSLHDKVRLLIRLGDIYYIQNDRANAASVYSKAQPYISELNEFEIHRDDRTYTRMAHCIATAGGAYGLSASLAPAEDAFKSSSMKRNSLDPHRQADSLDLLTAETVLADIVMRIGESEFSHQNGPGIYTGNLEKADLIYARLSQQWNQGPYISKKNTGLSELCRGVVLETLGRYSAAAECINRGLPYLVGEFGEHSSVVKFARAKRADQLWKVRDFAAALIERFKAKLS